MWPHVLALRCFSPFRSLRKRGVLRGRLNRPHISDTVTGCSVGSRDPSTIRYSIRRAIIAILLLAIDVGV